MQTLLLTFFLSAIGTGHAQSPAPQGTSTHGGQSEALELVKYARQALENLQVQNASPEKIEAFRKSLETTYVIAKEHVYVETPWSEIVEVDAINEPHRTPPTIVVSQSRWPGKAPQQKLELSYHEFGGILGWERDRYFDTARTELSTRTCNMNFLAAIEPLQAAVDRTYADPYYTRWLVPGQIPYTQIFSAYDDLASLRTDNVQKYRQALAALKMDENGLIEIRKFSTDSVYLQMYGNALQASLSQSAGLQVVGRAVVPQYITISKGLPGAMSYMGKSFTGEFDLILFATADPSAEHDIEKIKMGMFKNLEEAVSVIRRRVLQIHTEDQKLLREHQILLSVFGSDPSESEILRALKILDQSETQQLHVFSQTFRQISQAEVASGLEKDLTQQRKNLEEILRRRKLLNKCLAQGAQ